MYILYKSRHAHAQHHVTNSLDSLLYFIIIFYLTDDQHIHIVKCYFSCRNAHITNVYSLPVGLLDRFAPTWLQFIRPECTVHILAGTFVGLIVLNSKFVRRHQSHQLWHGRPGWGPRLQVVNFFCFHVFQQSS